MVRRHRTTDCRILMLCKHRSSAIDACGLGRVSCSGQSQHIPTYPRNTNTRSFSHLSRKRVRSIYFLQRPVLFPAHREKALSAASLRDCHYLGLFFADVCLGCLCVFFCIGSLLRPFVQNMFCIGFGMRYCTGFVQGFCLTFESLFLVCNSGLRSELF